MQISEDQKLQYYLTHPQLGFLSNFYQSPFKADDRQYFTNQHYFQSMKFQGHPHQLTIANSKDPFQAFQLGRTRKFAYRNGWKNMKEDIMYKGLKLKFNQNLNLKEKLMSTRDKIIIEHDDTDFYWSDGGDGSGKNRMGHLLMKLRQQYRTQKVQISQTK